MVLLIQYYVLLISIQEFMALGTICLFPRSTYVHRMFKFKVFFNIGVFHLTLFTLSYNIMAEITIT